MLESGWKDRKAHRRMMERERKSYNHFFDVISLHLSHSSTIPHLFGM
jgi:hypothetical protein